MSDWLKSAPARQNDTRQFISVSLEPSDRLALHARIAQRYRAMLELGLVKEVRALHERADLHTGLPSIRCVGYRQLWDYLDGNISLDQAVRSEEHTSELQSVMRNPYAVFCLEKQKNRPRQVPHDLTA